jgi:hypothetical protein
MPTKQSRRILLDRRAASRLAMTALFLMNQKKLLLL